MEGIQNENLSVESNDSTVFDENKLTFKLKEKNLINDEVKEIIKENNENLQAVSIDNNMNINLEKDFSNKLLINETEIKISELSLCDKKLKNDKKIEEDTSEDEYYDVSSDGTLNVKVEELNSLSENKSLDRKSEDEREQGDGEESNEIPPNENLDDDEDKRNPQYIPKRGAFYEHDDRVLVEGEVEDDLKNSELTEDKQLKILSNETVKENTEVIEIKKKNSKWSHDLFDVKKQIPKSNVELVHIYGYDIREEEEAPKPRRRKRYGRGLNKYFRGWKNQDTYNQTNSKYEKRSKKSPVSDKNRENFQDKNYTSKITTLPVNNNSNLDNTFSNKQKDLIQKEETKSNNLRDVKKKNKEYEKSISKNGNIKECDKSFLKNENIKECDRSFSRDRNLREQNKNIVKDRNLREYDKVYDYYKESNKNSNFYSGKKFINRGDRKNSSRKRDDNYGRKDYDKNNIYKDNRKQLPYSYGKEKIKNDILKKKIDKSENDFSEKSNEKKTFSNDDFPELSNNDLLKSKTEKFIDENNAWNKYKKNTLNNKEKEDKIKELDLNKSEDLFLSEKQSFNNSKFSIVNNKKKFPNFKNLTTNNQIYQETYKGFKKESIKFYRNNNNLNDVNKSNRKNYYDNVCFSENKNISSSLNKSKAKNFVDNQNIASEIKVKNENPVKNVGKTEIIQEINKPEINLNEKELNDNLQNKLKRYQSAVTKIQQLPQQNLSIQQSLQHIQTPNNNKHVTTKSNTVLQTNSQPQVRQVNNIISQQIVGSQHHQPQILNTVQQSPLQHLPTHLQNTIQSTQQQQHVNQQHVNQQHVNQQHLSQHHNTQYQQQSNHQNLAQNQASYYDNNRQSQNYYTENHSPRSSFAYIQTAQHNEDTQISRYLTHSQLATQYSATGYPVNPGAPTAANVVQQDQTSFIPTPYHPTHHAHPSHQYAAYAPTAQATYTQYTPTPQTYQSVAPPQVQPNQTPGEFSRGGVTYYDPRIQYMNNNLVRQIQTRKRQSNALPIIAPDTMLQQQYN